MKSPISGSASTPVLFIVSFVSVSVLVFFTVTRPACTGKEKSVPTTRIEDGGSARSLSISPQKLGSEGSGVPEGGATHVVGETNEAEDLEPRKPGNSPTDPDDLGTRRSELESRYAPGSPAATVSVVAGFLREGDFESLRRTLGHEVLTDKKAGNIERLFAELGVKIDQEEPISQFANVLRNPRWAINLDRTTPEGFPNRILLDFEKVDSAGRGGIWKVSEMFIPPVSAFATAVAGSDGPAEGSRGDEFPASLRGADAITVADAFVHCVVTQQFKLAKRLALDPNLNFEQIAALCIVFEDEQFELLSEEAPLRQTQERESNAWVLSYMKSKQLGNTTQFGLEMARNKDGEWTVASVLLDSILETYAKVGGGATEDTFYAPIVKNPKGGDSLPIFFKFGSAELVPRGTAQVEVIGNILLANPERTLKISGYADAQGSEDYNFRLSATRGYAVRTRLIEMGVAEDRVDVKAFGETKPLSPEVRADGSDNVVGRAENRRTEILLDF